jgi:aminopeptidase N
LRSGANELTIDATGVYMNTGEGLHRFVDPVDDEVYLYSQFEVADCRRMFAVFEQPDLKATFAFTVTAPRTGRSSPTSPRSGGSPQAGHNRRGRRVPSAPGPSAHAEHLLLHHRADRRPVRRGARRGPDPQGRLAAGHLLPQSLTPHLDADNIFDCTKRGFAFYENEFDCAYPFTSTTRSSRPEYNMGAMENAGR